MPGCIVRRIADRVEPSAHLSLGGLRHPTQHLKPDVTLEDPARMVNPVVRGWIRYVGQFYKSELNGVLRHRNCALVHWARRKYKKLARHRRRAEHGLGRIARREPTLFAHWDMGILPAVA